MERALFGSSALRVPTARLRYSPRSRSCAAHLRSPLSSYVRPKLPRSMIILCGRGLSCVWAETLRCSLSLVQPPLRGRRASLLSCPLSSLLLLSALYWGHWAWRGGRGRASLGSGRLVWLAEQARSRAWSLHTCVRAPARVAGWATPSNFRIRRAGLLRARGLSSTYIPCSMPSFSSLLVPWGRSRWRDVWRSIGCDDSCG